MNELNAIVESAQTAFAAAATPADLENAKAKVSVGKSTDSPTLVAKGLAQEAKGKLQSAMGKVKGKTGNRI